jgi:hypothetical protein
MSVENPGLSAAHVLAHMLARQIGVRWVIDLGCEANFPHRRYLKGARLLAVGSPQQTAKSIQGCWRPVRLNHNLAQGLPDISPAILRQAVVVGTQMLDKSEHLEALARWAQVVPLMLLGGPRQPTAQIQPGWLWGYPVGHNSQEQWPETLAVAGTHAQFVPQTRSFRVAAIVHAYNEVDILEEVVRHLVEQGLEVHLFDNWSNDGSWELAQQLAQQGMLAHLDRIPAQPTTTYEWLSQLRHKAQYAATLKADWILHTDADEFRFGPWPEVRLLDALNFVDALGYNAVDFSHLLFSFVQGQEQTQPPYLEHLRYFRPDQILKLNAWKNQNQPVDLVTTGGHECKFPGRRVFPIRFLLRHYSLRNLAQARKKMIYDRLPRLKREELALGMHDHIPLLAQQLEEGTPHPTERFFWQDTVVAQSFVLERLFGLGRCIDIEEGWARSLQRRWSDLNHPLYRWGVTLLPTNLKNRLRPMLRRLLSR